MPPASPPPGAAPARNGLTYHAGWDTLILTSPGLGAGRAPVDVSAAVGRYLAQGGNLLDLQGAPDAMGAGLAQSLNAGHLRREQVVVCGEGRPGPVPDALAPAAVRQQVRAVREAARLAQLDLFWLAGADAVFAAAGEAALRDTFREAFAALEVAAAQGEIAAYGLALEAVPFSPHLLLEIAEDVLGSRHRLRALRLPAAALAGRETSWPAGLTVLATAGPDGSAPVPAGAAAVIVEAAAWVQAGH